MVYDNLLTVLQIRIHPDQVQNNQHVMRNLPMVVCRVHMCSPQIVKYHAYFYLFLTLMVSV